MFVRGPARLNGKAVTKQTFAILPKIREVDALLQMRPELREVVREVHPEVCFSELAGVSMTHHKASALGREERQRALLLSFPQLQTIEKAGRDQGLPIEDILDGTSLVGPQSAWLVAKVAAFLTLFRAILQVCQWLSGFEVVTRYVQGRAFHGGP